MAQKSSATQNNYWMKHLQLHSSSSLRAQTLGYQESISKARRGLWPEAAADAALAFEHQPISIRVTPMVAALIVKSHNRTDYEELCKRLLKMSPTQPTSTLLIRWRSLPLSSIFGSDLQVVGLPGRHRSDARELEDPGAMPFYQDCKALAEYRRGHLCRAVNGSKTLNSPHLCTWTCLAVLAMAYWQLGLKVKRERFYAKATHRRRPLSR